MLKIVKVLLPYAFNKTFDYIISGEIDKNRDGSSTASEELNNHVDSDIKVGDIVRVPFGNREEFGVVWEIRENTQDIDNQKQ